MTYKAPAMTGLGHFSQRPLLEWCHGYWKLWLAYDSGVPLGRACGGTFLVLSEDGSIQRMTTEPTGSVSHTILIKPSEPKMSKTFAVITLRVNVIHADGERVTHHELRSRVKRLLDEAQSAPHQPDDFYLTEPVLSEIYINGTGFSDPETD